MGGAIIISQTDAPSQEAVVGSAQRVVVECARAPHGAAVQHNACLEYLDSSWNPYFGLEESARSVVYSWRVYVRKLQHV